MASADAELAKRPQLPNRGIHRVHSNTQLPKRNMNRRRDESRPRSGEGTRGLPKGSDEEGVWTVGNAERERKEGGNGGHVG